MIEVVLYLLAAVIGYAILWAIIRGAVLSALVKHDSLVAASAERSQAHERYVERAAESRPAPRPAPAPVRPTGKLWTGTDDSA